MGTETGRSPARGGDTAHVNIDEVNGSAIVIQHSGHKGFGREIINEARV